MAHDVEFVIDQQIAQFLFVASGPRGKAGDAVDDIHRQMEAIQIVEDRHVEWGGGRAFLLITANVQIIVIGAAVSEAMDQPRISVKREDDGLIGGEDRIEIGVGNSVGMLASRL